MPFSIPSTLPEIVRYALANQLATIYEKAGGKDRLTFTEKAYGSSDEELQKAAKLAATLAHVNVSVLTMQKATDQITLAMTTTLTTGKDGADHE